MLEDGDDANPRATEREQQLLVHRIVRNVVELCGKCCGARPAAGPGQGAAERRPVFKLLIAKYADRVAYSGGDAAAPAQEDLSVVLHVIKGCVEDLQVAHSALSRLDAALAHPHGAPPAMPPPPDALVPVPGAALPGPAPPAGVSVSEYTQWLQSRRLLEGTLEQALLLLHHHLQIAWCDGADMSGWTGRDAAARVHDYRIREATLQRGAPEGLQGLRKAAAQVDVRQLFESVEEVTRPMGAMVPQGHLRTDFAYRVCELIRLMVD